MSDPQPHRPAPPEVRTVWVGAGEGRLLARTLGEAGRPAILFLHGWPQTGRAWDGIAADLAHRAHCLMPDLRGFGDSAKPATGYGMGRLAADLVALLDRVGVARAVVVAHDLGGPAAWALAHDHPERVAAVAFIETPFPGAPLPGAEGLLLRFPHLLFHADVDLASWLIAGRERAYLDHFMRQFAGDPDRATAGLDIWAAALAQPGALRASLEHYRVWSQNADTGARMARTPLSCPVVAWDGEHSMGGYCLDAARSIARAATGGTLAGAGHWIAEENPAALIRIVHELIDPL